MTAEWVRQVLVVDDEPFIRGLIAQVVADAGFDVIAVGSAREALDALDTHDPEAAILDIELGAGPNGLDLALILREYLPHIALVFLTQVAAPELAQHSPAPPEQAAYLVKRDIADPALIIRALELVLTDGDPRPEFRADIRRTDPLMQLSPAQRETLRLVAEGLTNEEIARRRGTTVRATEAMISRVFTLLDLSGDARISPRVAATRLYARYAGLPSGQSGG